MQRTSFTHSSPPGRIVFGYGSLSTLSDEIDRQGLKRALILCTPMQAPDAARLLDGLGQRAAGLFDSAVMHVPIETAREARRIAADVGADCAIAFGGGSTVGLGKAIALDSGLPIIAIPTTYAGSEMTPIYGLTEGGIKKTGRDARVLPRTVIYDPALSLNLPLPMTFASGMNAIAHAAEALYAFDGNPVISLMAEESVRAMYSALLRLREDATNREARWDALYATWLAGSVLGQVSMGLHHKLCHTLGGTFNLPHAETHAIMLPHTMAYNAGASDAMARLARALGNADVPSALYELLLRLEIPSSLKQIGMPDGGVDRAVDLALSTPYPNPRPLEENAVRALLERAFAGARPVP